MHQFNYKRFSGSASLLPALAFFKHNPLHFGHSWDSTRDFFDLHYCSGAISSWLHMGLINLIPSGNSRDTWAWHCCLLTLLFTFSTACVSFGYIHAICLWKRSKDGPYDLGFGIVTLRFLSIDGLFGQTTDRHCHLFLCVSNQNKIAAATAGVADKTVHSARPVHEGPLYFLTGGPPVDQALFFFIV